MNTTRPQLAALLVALSVTACADTRWESREAIPESVNDELPAEIPDGNPSLLAVIRQCEDAQEQAFASFGCREQLSAADFFPVCSEMVPRWVAEGKDPARHIELLYCLMEHGARCMEDSDHTTISAPEPCITDANRAAMRAAMGDR